jgi:hypothetical protein
LPVPRQKSKSLQTSFAGFFVVMDSKDACAGSGEKSVGRFTSSCWFYFNDYPLAHELDGKIMFNFKTAIVTAAFCAAAATPSMAEDLVFKLINGTNSVLTHFYTSPVGVDNWEGDVFGSQVLKPGESGTVTITDGRDVCEYDMRFEFEGSADLDTTEDTQNLCELSEYTIEE